MQPRLHEMSKSYFFLGYFEYFKPGPVQCLNKLWHWAILTLSPTTAYILMSLVCGEGDFHWIHPDLNHPQGDKRFHSGGEQDSSGVVGTRSVEKEMKYVLDLNRLLVNWRLNKVESTTQSAPVKCLANSNLMSCQKERWDKHQMLTFTKSGRWNPTDGWMEEHFKAKGQLWKHKPYLALELSTLVSIHCVYMCMSASLCVCSLWNMLAFCSCLWPKHGNRTGSLN